MSDIDEKKPTGKSGKRKKNADQRSRKSDQKQRPKADQQSAPAAQIDTLMVASTDIAPIEAAVSQAQTETAIMTVDALPLAAHEVSEPPVVLKAPAETPPVAVEDVKHKSEVTARTADALPIPTPAERAPPSAVVRPVDMAPIATPDVEQPTAALIATQIEAAPVPTTDARVSLQTIANAYSEYTMKSFEQTKCFFEKLTGVRSLDQAVEIQTEFAKQACETFVAEAQKISEMHRELARQRLERLESLVVVGPQTSRWV